MKKTPGLERTLTLFKEERERSQFHSERLTGFGGSDIGSLYNLGFGCLRRTAYQKLEYPPDFPKNESPELERGTLLEPVVRQLYEKRTGRKVKIKELQRHDEYPWMIVHVDGEVTAPEHEGPGYAEFKCVNRFVMKKFKKEGMREEYILQLNHGMFVGNYSWGSFGVLCLDPWDFAWFDADRDDDLVAKLIEDERKAWERIQAKELPEPLENIKDKRCASCEFRRTCRGNELAAVSDSQAAAGGEELLVREDLAPLLEEIAELGEIVNEAKGLHDDARDKLKKEIGEAYGIIVPGYRALYPTSYPERFDTAALKSLIKQAEDLLAKPDGLMEPQELYQAYKEVIALLATFTKAKKAPKAERSLRIYATGD